MSISVIICGAAGSLLWNASSQRSEIAARGELIDIGAAAFEIMERYLREIPQNECPGNPTPCLAGNAQVSTATATQVRWGVNGFRKQGSELQMTKDSATTWYALATDVTNLQITYYNRLGQDLLTVASPGDEPNNIRRIVIRLTLARSNQTVILRTGIYLRNFMNEVASDP